MNYGYGGEGCAMMSLITLLLAILITLPHLDPALASRASGVQQNQSPNIQTTYDAAADKTIVKLAPVKIGAAGKYHSVHMSPSFSFPGRTAATPAIVDFELQTVVKGRLRTDLYVVFVIDGETVFLSSNRWAIKRPIPGRVWVGERLLFRMPYETLVKVTKAKTFAIKFDGLRFDVGETEKQALRELLSYMKPAG